MVAPPVKRDVGRYEPMIIQSVKVNNNVRSKEDTYRAAAKSLTRDASFSCLLPSLGGPLLGPLSGPVVGGPSGGGGHWATTRCMLSSRRLSVCSCST
jgi:hypothetical protein